MGTWGTGILQDDFALDVYGEYLEAWYTGSHTPESIRALLEHQFEDAVSDDDDGPIFWLALARAQWECGVLQPDVLANVQEAIAQGRSLERWQEASDPRDFGRRKAVLKRFLATISTPRTKPRSRQGRR